MPAAFTICSNNYLAKASIAAETFMAKHNDYSFSIFLVDEFAPEIDYNIITAAKVIGIKEVVPGIEELAKKYNIIELNTAVKPAVFTFLFEKFKSNHIIYIDPDVMVFDNFSGIEDLFQKENCNIIVTPHFCSPIDDGKIPSEIHFSTYGLYNLGFLAVKNSTESQKFLSWWHDRLMKYSFIDPANGMFTDQLWINYAPLFFEGVYVLKHLGYNVANWNLYERQIDKINETYYINETVKLVFFHFSHYVFNNPYQISARQNRHHADDFEDLKVIIDQYQSKLIQNNHTFFSAIPCYYQLLYESYQKSIKKPDSTFKKMVQKARKKAIRVAKRTFLQQEKTN